MEKYFSDFLTCWWYIFFLFSLNDFMRIVKYSTDFPYVVKNFQKFFPQAVRKIEEDTAA